MNNINYYSSIYFMLMSSFMFCVYYKHLLLTLISLEFIVISLIYNMFTIMMIVECNMFMITLLILMMVCEGALSLSLIILMVRYYGNDYINSLSILKW